MALRFILDGYNIIRQAFSKNDSLKSERERLLGFIESYRPQGSPRNKVTVVFDGREDLYAPRNSSPVEVIFSKGESADECIRKLTEKSPDSKSVVVVTGDRELKFSVKANGAKTMSVKEFLSKAKVNKPKSPETREDLPLYLSYKITSELKHIWLKEK